jgi:hypothetical protein
VHFVRAPKEEDHGIVAVSEELMQPKDHIQGYL